MKKLIRCQYVPDMTERYPDGQRDFTDTKYVDPISLPTLSQVLRKLMNDDDYYSRVRIIDNGTQLYEYVSLDDALDDWADQLDKKVEHYEWFNDRITIELF